MRIGLQAMGIGSGADVGVITAVARAAEQTGFATLWAGEHVVLVDNPTSTYPYSADGRLAVPSDADWLDPLITLATAAAVTTSIRVATGVLLLAEHNPVLVAKQAATLDRLSEGRLCLGVGAGWSKEEYEAMGVPFERRYRRLREYVAVLRTLWADDVATYDGELVRFSNVRLNPKPVRDRDLPVLMGGNSPAALGRAVDYCDGWYGFDLGPDDAARCIGVLRRLCAAAGRDEDQFEVVVAPFTAPPGRSARDEYAALGVDELVVVAEPPAAAADVVPWTERLAEEWI